jgi:hypothetical protein
LERAFTPDTAAKGFPLTTPSAGQCAAVSAIVHFDLGAELASAHVGGLSHWFNRFPVGEASLDVDLTGDQFGQPPVQVAVSGSLYEDTRRRNPSELHVETLERARRLADRAGLSAVSAKIARELASRRSAPDVQHASSFSRIG